MHQTVHKNIIKKKFNKITISLDGHSFLTFKKRIQENLALSCQQYIFIIHKWSKVLQGPLLVV